MLAITVVILTILIDQLTKWWADNVLQHLSGGRFPLIDGVLSFDHELNPGMAWGLLAEHRWVFLLLTTLVLGVILVFFAKTRKYLRHPLLDVSMSLLLAGGTSNMIDRTFFSTEALFEGKVIDFISFDLIDFPVFNVADIAVCVGMGLFIIYMLFVEPKIDTKKYLILFKDEKNKNTPAQASDAPAGETEKEL